MKIITDSKKINELLTRGVDKIIEKKSLIKKLKSGKRLRIKYKNQIRNRSYRPKDSYRKSNFTLEA